MNADSTSRLCCSIVACHLSFYIRWPEATHWRLSDITHAQGPLEETEGDNREKPSERERGGGNRGFDLERQAEIQRQRDRDRQTDRQNREERTIPKRARKRERRVMLRARLANRPRLMGRMWGEDMIADAWSLSPRLIHSTSSITQHPQSEWNANRNQSKCQSQVVVNACTSFLPSLPSSILEAWDNVTTHC